VLDLDRPLLAVASRFDFEGQRLARLRSPAFSRERRDVNEDRFTAAHGANEAKAPIVVLLVKLAFESHGAGFRSMLD